MLTQCVGCTYEISIKETNKNETFFPHPRIKHSPLTCGKEYFKLLSSTFVSDACEANILMYKQTQQFETCIAIQITQSRILFLLFFSYEKEKAKIGAWRRRVDCV